MTNTKKRVALGMSGGVDSSLSAHLLIEQGYEVVGVYLECWRAPGCRTDQDRQDALKVALELGMPFQVLDFKQQYRHQVVEYFFNEYKAGRTPNPDVMCNKEIKFGLFYDWAMTHDFDYVATGHYAKSTEAGELLIPKDDWKDQTYFLYLLTQDQLQHTLFPLAKLTKDEVRAEAERRGIHVAEKKDSVGICFIGDIDVREFLRERLGEKPGEVVDHQGNVLGSHQGVWFYTIGQRHGFTIHPKSQITQADGQVVERTNLPPFYVIGKDAVKNQLVVGFGADAYRQTFAFTDLHLIDEGARLPTQLLARIRHTGEKIPAQIEDNRVKLAKEVKGISPGQSVVFYAETQDGVKCLGGAVIN